MAAATATPASPVPLDTIPISPEGGIGEPGIRKEQESALNGGEAVTVFHNADNFNVKHPLANTWTLWFTKPPSGKVSRKTRTHT